MNVQLAPPQLYAGESRPGIGFMEIPLSQSRLLTNRKQNAVMPAYTLDLTP
jgi:hypothetical protein